MLSSILLAATLQFGSPVNFPMTLAGNFGEPRPNHFHGGIDVRTGMSVGKPIFAIAEGYVSRITVSLGGFGNALYVCHPNGYTSVYCHLNKFAPPIRAQVSRYRHEHGQKDIIDAYRSSSAPVDIRLKPTDCPVALGQLIAVSGNTGSSEAPHLHLEMHDSQTNDMVDPLDFLKEFMKDTTPPVAHAFKAYPVEGKGIFCENSAQQTFTLTSHHLNRIFTAWGEVGFGIWANDYMEEAYGRYGIRKTELKVDGQTVFKSNVDNIPMLKNRMVNSWGDFEHFQRMKVWYMKSFIQPGNSLPVLQADENRGIVKFNREKVYHIEYALTDIYGNESKYTFSVKGKKQPLPSHKPRHAPWVLRWNKVNNFQMPGIQLLVRKGLLPDDVQLRPEITKGTKGYSNACKFTATVCPLFNWAELSLKLKKPVNDPSRLCIVGNNGKVYKAKYHNGWITAHVRELGVTYEIDNQITDK